MEEGGESAGKALQPDGAGVYRVGFWGGALWSASLGEIWGVGFSRKEGAGYRGMVRGNYGAGLAVREGHLTITNEA